MLFQAADRIIKSSFYLLFFLVPFIFTPLTSELFEFNKMILTYVITVVITASWAIKSILGGKLIFRRTILDIPLLLFLTAQIISTVFSIDQHTSIWGYHSRSHGGLLSTISYLFLYWAFVSNMGKQETRSAIRNLLASALIVSIWGIAERLGSSPSCIIMKKEFGVDCWVQKVQERIFATLGQPNWFAAWLTAIIPITWAFAISKKKWWWIGMSIIFFTAILFTKSRSGLLGFGASFAVFWLTMAWLYKDRLKILTRPFLLLITFYLLLVTIFGTPWTPSATEVIQNNINRKPPTVNHPNTGTVLETGGTESGEIRKIVWNGAINTWRAYPLTGTGVETFAYSYYQFRPVEHNLTSEWDFLYNKAHNEYLNFAATTGTFGLVSYLIFIGATVWLIASRLRSGQNLLPALLAGHASILITNFFGFSVVNVAILFFLFPALAWSVTSDKLEVTSRNKKFSILQIASILLLILVTCYLLLKVFHVWYADVLFTKSKNLATEGSYALSLERIESALSLRTDEPRYYDQLAKITSSIALELEEKGDGASAQLANEASRYATTISPYNLNLLKSRVTILYRLVQVDQQYLHEALPVLEKAVELAPTDPKVRYNLGVLYGRLGQIERAEEVLEESVTLKPNYYDGRVGLATIYDSLGKQALAREQLEYVLQNIDPDDEEVQNKLEKLSK